MSGDEVLLPHAAPYLFAHSRTMGAPMSNHVPPSTNETAFSCPHCDAYTSQTWFNIYGQARSETIRGSAGKFSPD
jgi:hypothetical protein